MFWFINFWFNPVTDVIFLPLTRARGARDCPKGCEPTRDFYLPEGEARGQVSFESWFAVLEGVSGGRARTFSGSSRLLLFHPPTCHSVTHWRDTQNPDRRKNSWPTQKIRTDEKNTDRHRKSGQTKKFQTDTKNFDGRKKLKNMRRKKFQIFSSNIKKCPPKNFSADAKKNTHQM